MRIYFNDGCEIDFENVYLTVGSGGVLIVSDNDSRNIVAVFKEYAYACDERC